MKPTQDNERVKQVLYSKILAHPEITYAQLAQHTQKKELKSETFRQMLNFGVDCHLFSVRSDISDTDSRKDGRLAVHFAINPDKNAYYQYFGRFPKNSKAMRTAKPIQKKSIYEYLLRLIPAKSSISQIDIYRNIEKRGYSTSEMQSALDTGKRYNIFRTKTAYSNKTNSLVTFWSRTNNTTHLSAFLELKERKRKKGSNSRISRIVNNGASSEQSHDMTVGGGRKRSAEWNNSEARKLHHELYSLRYFRSQNGLNDIDRGALK